MTSNSARLSLLIAATVFFSSELPITASAQTVSFDAHQDFAVGTNPRSVAVGDFNGDLKPDLAVNHAESASIGVVLGNGDGTFQSEQTYAVGDRPQSVAVGDFNGDGKPDLAVAIAGGFGYGVSVLLGNGD